MSSDYESNSTHLSSTSLVHGVSATRVESSHRLDILCLVTSTLSDRVIGLWNRDFMHANSYPAITLF
jgi:hypothetical protein